MDSSVNDEVEIGLDGVVFLYRPAFGNAVSLE
jgi:hypothetical protein